MSKGGSSSTRNRSTVADEEEIHEIDLMDEDDHINNNNSIIEEEEADAEVATINSNKSPLRAKNRSSSEGTPIRLGSSNNEKKRRKNRDSIVPQLSGMIAPRSRKSLLIRTPLLDDQEQQQHSQASSSSDIDNQQQPKAKIPQPQLEELFQNCLKLSTENKINAKNAWKFDPFIDNMKDVLQQKSDFAFSSFTLDAGVKIFSYKVDSVHEDVFKVRGGLSRTSTKKGKKGGEDNDEDGGEDGDECDEEGDGEDKDNAANTTTTKKRSHHSNSGKTLEKDFGPINNKKFDLENTMHPLFYKAAADSGSSFSLLLNHLPVSNTLEVIFEAQNGILLHDDTDDDANNASNEKKEEQGAQQIEQQQREGEESIETGEQRSHQQQQEQQQEQEVHEEQQQQQHNDIIEIVLEKGDPLSQLLSKIYLTHRRRSTLNEVDTEALRSNNNDNANNVVVPTTTSEGVSAGTADTAEAVDEFPLGGGDIPNNLEDENEFFSVMSPLAPVPVPMGAEEEDSQQQHYEEDIDRAIDDIDDDSDDDADMHVGEGAIIPVGDDDEDQQQQARGGAVVADPLNDSQLSQPPLVTTDIMNNNLNSNLNNTMALMMEMTGMENLDFTNEFVYFNMDTIKSSWHPKQPTSRQLQDKPGSGSGLSQYSQKQLTAKKKKQANERSLFIDFLEVEGDDEDEEEFERKFTEKLKSSSAAKNKKTAKSTKNNNSNNNDEDGAITAMAQSDDANVDKKRDQAHILEILQVPFLMSRALVESFRAQTKGILQPRGHGAGNLTQMLMSPRGGGGGLLGANSQASEVGEGLDAAGAAATDSSGADGIAPHQVDFDEDYDDDDDGGGDFDHGGGGFEGDDDNVGGGGGGAENADLLQVDFKGLGIEEFEATTTTGDAAASQQQQSQQIQLIEMPATAKHRQNLKRANNGVNYSRQATRVDVRALKDRIWTTMCTDAKDNDNDSSDHHEHNNQKKQQENNQKSKEDMRMKSEKTFSELVASTTSNNAVAGMEDSNRNSQIAFCFICLLHLANEKGLVITNEPDLSDLRISQPAATTTTATKKTTTQQQQEKQEKQNSKKRPRNQKQKQQQQQQHDLSEEEEEDL